MSDADSAARTVTVKVWQGARRESADALVEEEDPDEYELPVADPEYGVLDALSDDEQVILAENIDHHGTCAFLVEPSEEAVELNVYEGVIERLPHQRAG